MKETLGQPKTATEQPKAAWEKTMSPEEQLKETRQAVKKSLDKLDELMYILNRSTKDGFDTRALDFSNLKTKYLAAKVELLSTMRKMSELGVKMDEKTINKYSDELGIKEYPKSKKQYALGEGPEAAIEDIKLFTEDAMELLSKIKAMQAIAKDEKININGISFERASKRYKLAGDSVDDAEEKIFNLEIRKAS